MVVQEYATEGSFRAVLEQYMPLLLGEFGGDGGALLRVWWGQVKVEHRAILTPPRQDAMSDTIVQSICRSAAGVIQGMPTIAAEIGKWVIKQCVALLDLDPAVGGPDLSLSPVPKRPLRRASAHLCSYSDAEFQIMLRELHYPNVKSNTAAPGSRNSISNCRSLTGTAWIS